MPQSKRIPFLAYVRVSHNSCTIRVQDEYATGGSSREAKANAMRVAADLLEFNDDHLFGATVDDNVVTILAFADWTPREFGQAILDVAEHCGWSDRGVRLLGDVRDDIGVTIG